MNVTTTHTLDFELSLEGIYQPGYAPTGPSYSSGGEPGEPACIEDPDILDIGVAHIVPAPLAERGSHPRGVWKTTSIFEGVDRKSDAFRQIIRNIMALCEQDIADALMDEHERAA